MKDLMNQVRWVLMAAVSMVLGVFILQNAAQVELQLFVWSVSSSRAYVILTCVFAGFLLGWLFGVSARRR